MRVLDGVDAAMMAASDATRPYLKTFSVSRATLGAACPVTKPNQGRGA